jgi:hypothetical protein
MERIIINPKDDDASEPSEDSDEENMKGVGRLPGDRE